MCTLSLNKLLIISTLSCFIGFSWAQDYSNSFSGYPRVFKKGRGLIGLRMCQGEDYIHPRNCPGGLRKRTNDDAMGIPNIPETASITEVYLENKQISLGSLYKLINDFLNLKNKGNDNNYDVIRQPKPDSYEDIRTGDETYDEMETPVRYGDLQSQEKSYGENLFDRTYDKFGLGEK